MLTAAEILVEDSVRHLGLRVVWVDEWHEVGEVLRIMLDDKPRGAKRIADRVRTPSPDIIVPPQPQPKDKSGANH